MSNRITKCQHCEKKDRTEKIKGIHPKGYICPECIDPYEQRQKFIKKEQKEMDELVDTIVDIMGYSNRQSIPSSFYSGTIQPFRNNSDIMRRIKRYKEGFTYKTIKETFEYCKNDIVKYVGIKRNNNEFKNTHNELRYAWSIMANNIENYIRSKRREALAEKRQKIKDNLKRDKIVNESIKEVKYKSKSSDYDISDLLN